jgi:hypothetical protein
MFNNRLKILLYFPPPLLNQIPTGKRRGWFFMAAVTEIFTRF